MKLNGAGQDNAALMQYIPSLTPLYRPLIAILHNGRLGCSMMAFSLDAVGVPWLLMQRCLAAAPTAAYR